MYKNVQTLIYKSLINNQTKYGFGKILKKKPVQTKSININDKQFNKELLQSAKSIIKTVLSIQMKSSSNNFDQQDYQQPQQINKHASKIKQKPIQNVIPANLEQIDYIKQYIQQIRKLDIVQYQKRIMTTPNKQLIKQLLQKVKRTNIINHTIQVLINQKSFTLQLRQFLTKFILSIAILYKRNIYQAKSINVNISEFKQFMEMFNSYFLLIQLNKKVIMTYLFLMVFLIQTHIIESNRMYFVNQKIIIDYILKNKNNFKLSNPEIVHMLSYINASSLMLNYPHKFYQLVDFILSKLTNHWYQTYQFFKPLVLKKIIIQLTSLNYDCAKLTNGLVYILNQQITHQNFDTFCISFNSILNLKAQIYINKPIPQLYIKSLKKISKFIKQNFITKINKLSQNKLSNKNESKSKRQSPTEGWSQKSKQQQKIIALFQKLMPTLMRSSIWQQQIWHAFADWLDTSKNYQKIKIINLYTIFQLLKIDNDIIPGSIIQRLNKSKNNILLRHSFNIQSVDLIKQYHIEFGDRLRGAYTIQQQVANNLRTVNKRIVKTQTLSKISLLLNSPLFHRRYFNRRLNYLIGKQSIPLYLKLNKIKQSFQFKKFFQKKDSLKTRIQILIIRCRCFHLRQFFKIFQVTLNLTQGNYQFLTLMEKQFQKHQHFKKLKMLNQESKASIVV